MELSLAGAGHITIVNRPQDMLLGDSLMALLKRMRQAAAYVSWEKTYEVPADTDILINATPIGLYPNVDQIPDIQLDSILPSMFVQDVIPNPAITPFLAGGRGPGGKMEHRYGHAGEPGCHQH